ncbi:hypothetical protein POX_f07654 [Penicillium oxalicum]|uniref:hypothetical protein n=1 Tax=Penicillium oxalicum TaxID=69781 RepID=UPI0020B7D144|nr:hypothetical protein POX_f07654 [Penicillium oxalicum]KAI2787291.1 hypothetical protein POX_f07654 [Penicillium oxalicum]
MSTSLEIQPVTADDVPAITQLWYTAFGIPLNLRMFPDTPGVRGWWNEANRQDVLSNPRRTLLKVVDPATDQIVAYAKWDLDPSDSGARFPPWHAESDRETCERLFAGMEQQRKAFFGDRKHFLSRSRGGIDAGPVGVDRADEKGVPVYLDAHEDAAPLYRRFGFQDCYEHGVTSDGALPMVREPQQKER